MSHSDKHVRDSEYIAGRLLECRRFIEDGKYDVAAELLRRAATYLDVSVTVEEFRDQARVLNG